MDFNTILDTLKVGVGLVYLYLEYKARPSMWAASIVMPIIGMILFYNKGLYADAAINVYYLLIAVYGFYKWTRGATHHEGRPQPITHVAPLTAAILAAVWAAVWCTIWWVLVSFTDSTVPVLDSFTTSMSIVGMWMLARKYIEQWIVWLVVDAVYVYLYYKKAVYFSGTLYGFYTVMAIAGYLKWRQMMSQDQSRLS